MRFTASIEPKTTLSILVGHLVIEQDRLRVVPRSGVLRIASGQAVEAIVRLEAYAVNAEIIDRLQAKIVDALAQLLTSIPAVGALQLDFDATHSQRPAYRRLLTALAQRIPLPISITALASWCYGDPWLRGLPITFAVPMLFRMGADSATIRSRVMAHRLPMNAMCRKAVGISLDEPILLDSLWPRAYLFPAGRWTPDRYARLHAMIARFNPSHTLLLRNEP